MKELEEEHLEVFGVKPFIIGLHWSDNEKLYELISEAIDKNIPYDERNELTKEELKQFENGNLTL